MPAFFSIARAAQVLPVRAASTPLRATPLEALADLTIDPSRTTVTAPGAVILRATGVSDAILRETEFFWDFGEGYDFRSLAADFRGPAGARNSRYARGAIVGHAYRTPGTYTPLLVAHYRGEVATLAGDAVTVADPDVTFAGRQTLWVADEASAAAVQAAVVAAGHPQPHIDDCYVASRLYAAVMASSNAGKRVRLRRGDTFHRLPFRGTGGLIGPDPDTPNASYNGLLDAGALGMLDAWGAGADPILTLGPDFATQSVAALWGVTTPLLRISGGDGVTVANLNLAGGYDAANPSDPDVALDPFVNIQGVTVSGDSQNTTLHRVVSDGWHDNWVSGTNTVYADVAVSNWYDYGVTAIEAPRGVIVGSSVRQPLNTKADPPSAPTGTRKSVNYAGQVNYADHGPLRVAQAEEFAIHQSHIEAWGGWTGGQPALRLQSGNDDAPAALWSLAENHVTGGGSVIAPTVANELNPMVAQRGFVLDANFIEATRDTRKFIGYAYGNIESRNNVYFAGDHPIDTTQGSLAIFGAAAVDAWLDVGFTDASENLARSLADVGTIRHVNNTVIVRTPSTVQFDEFQASSYYSVNSRDSVIGPLIEAGDFDDDLVGSGVENGTTAEKYDWIKANVLFVGAFPTEQFTSAGNVTIAADSNLTGGDAFPAPAGLLTSGEGAGIIPGAGAAVLGAASNAPRRSYERALRPASAALGAFELGADPDWPAGLPSYAAPDFTVAWSRTPFPDAIYSRTPVDPAGDHIWPVVTVTTPGAPALQAAEVTVRLFVQGQTGKATYEGVAEGFVLSALDAITLTARAETHPFSPIERTVAETVEADLTLSGVRLDNADALVVADPGGPTIPTSRQFTYAALVKRARDGALEYLAHSRTSAGASPMPSIGFTPGNQFRLGIETTAGAVTNEFEGGPYLTDDLVRIVVMVDLDAPSPEPMWRAWVNGAIVAEGRSATNTASPAAFDLSTIRLFGNNSVGAPGQTFRGEILSDVWIATDVLSDGDGAPDPATFAAAFFDSDGAPAEPAPDGSVAGLTPQIRLPATVSAYVGGANPGVAGGVLTLTGAVEAVSG